MSFFLLLLRSISPVNISLFCVISSSDFCLLLSYVALRVAGRDGQDGRPGVHALCQAGHAGGGTGRGGRRLGRAVRGEPGL